MLIARKTITIATMEKKRLSVVIFILRNWERCDSIEVKNVLNSYFPNLSVIYKKGNNRGYRVGV